jgi:hypothetical protein
MVNDSECIVIWAIPSWDVWATFEQAALAPDGGPLADWKRTALRLGADWQRSLLVDAPLAPLRTGRQPQESDRVPLDDGGL